MLTSLSKASNLGAMGKIKKNMRFKQWTLIWTVDENNFNVTDLRSYVMLLDNI